MDVRFGTSMNRSPRRATSRCLRVRRRALRRGSSAGPRRERRHRPGCPAGQRRQLAARVRGRTHARTHADRLRIDLFMRWSVPGSNRRPPACKAGALPTELTPRSLYPSRSPGALRPPRPLGIASSQGLPRVAACRTAESCQRGLRCVAPSFAWAVCFGRSVIGQTARPRSESEERKWQQMR
jgi:hypothetical protein